MHAAGEVATVVLAGGRATRFPGKLAYRIEGEPMLTALVRRFMACGPVVIAGEPDPALALPGVQIVPDLTPGGGPVPALAHVMESLAYGACVVLAGDMPNAGAPLFERLIEAYRTGDEAVVPEHSGRIEPLASLYERAAFVRASRAARNDGVSSMHGVLERLAVRRVGAPAEWFVNINNAQDLQRIAHHRGTA